MDLELLRHWLIVAILGILIICWGRTGLVRSACYEKMTKRGCYNDYRSFEEADRRFVVATCITIGYATLALVLTLFPLPF